MTAPIYAVGDIHGQLSMLDDALALIEADGGAGEPVVFLRDYVDRG
ncbi:MAG: serine/threonine protein phosphatase, partial [Marivivens sp.]